LWHRGITLIYDKKKLVTVHIDEQPVRTFLVAGTSVMTSADSERIRIEFDKNKMVWRSSIRDRDFGNGPCIKLPQK
jgi:hypothetical protein